MAKQSIGKYTILAETPEEAEEIVAAIKTLNESVLSRLGGKKLCVATRFGNGWRMIDGGPHDPYQCVMLAASGAEVSGAVFGVFVMQDDDSETGPEVVFGRPGAVARAWIEDIAPESRNLALGMDASVRLNAARIEAHAIAPLQDGERDGALT